MDILIWDFGKEDLGLVLVSLSNKVYRIRAFSRGLTCVAVFWLMCLDDTCS